MDNFSAFRPMGGALVLQNQSSASSSPTQCSTRASGDVAYLFYNQGGSDAFVGYGMTSGAAASRAVVPVVGVPPVSAQVMVPAGTLQTFTLVANLFFCTVMDPASGQNAAEKVFIQPGDGV